MKHDLLLKLNPTITGRVQISRSFSFRLNAGNYESREFFCAQKAECEAADMEAIGEAVYQFCKRSVMKSVAEWEEHAVSQFAPKPARRAS